MSSVTAKRTRAQPAQAPQRRRRAQLLKAIATLEAGEMGVPQLMALAEAEFRLAILPETDRLEAIDRLRKAIGYDPLHPKFFLHLGRLRQIGGDYAGALPEYRSAVRLAPANHRTVLHLALVLLELEESERVIGRALLDALAGDRNGEIKQLMADLDALIASRMTRSEVKGGGSAGQKRPGTDPGKARYNAVLPGRDGSWRLLLVERLSRPKPEYKQIDNLLLAGAQHINGQQGLTDYATACLYLTLDGRDVDNAIEKGELRSRAEHPAVRLLEASSALARIEEPEAFAARAVSELKAGNLPAELVSWLHYSKCGPDTSLPVADALRLLDTYPAELQQHHCLRELRVAILDGYARKAWSEGRFDRARLLWREAASLDPERTAIAHNLALLAARTKSREDYADAWERGAELRYLRAAALSDVRVDLEDRRALHIAFVQQSMQRHCGPSKTPKQDPSKEMLRAWIADRDALDVWLREWNLYYLNSRLRFRSPVHILGVPRDVAPKAMAEARDSLLRQIDRSLRGASWPGIQVFCRLATGLVDDAFERASDLVQRARDPYYEYEKTDADALTNEAIERGFLLHRMMERLLEAPTAANLRLGCAITAYQLALPWKILQPMCADRGMIDRDIDLLEAWEADLVRIAAADRPEPAGGQDLSEWLSAFADCIDILPRRPYLRFLNCQLLLTAKKYDDAYSSALDALAALSAVDDEETRVIKHNLISIIDGAAFEVLPEHLRQPESLEVAEQTLRVGQGVLDRFPRAGGLRAFLARLMIQIGDTARTEVAIELLEQGLELALNDDQTNDFKDLLKKARSQSGVAQAMERVNVASKRVSEAIAQINQSATAGAVERGQQAVADAIEAATEGERLAQKAGLEELAKQARDFLEQMQEIQRKLRRR